MYNNIPEKKQKQEERKKKRKKRKKKKKKTDVVAVVTFLLFNKNFYIVKSIKHNFTHKHFVVLFM